MSNQDKNAWTPPYVAYRTFWSFIEGLHAENLPARIDSSLMTNMSGSSRTALTAALRALKLIDAENRPTEALGELADTGRPKAGPIIKRLVTDAYPFVEDPNFDLKTATDKVLADRFREHGIAGSTVDKAVAFFIAAANESNMALSPYLKGTRAASKAPASRRTGPTQSRTRNPQPRRSKRVATQDPRTMLAEKILEKMPDYDPEWSDDVQTKWFEMMKQVMAAAEQPSDGKDE